MRPFVAGNWKMNHTPTSGRQFVKEISPKAKGLDADIVIFPPFVTIPSVVDEARGSNIKVGAQNLFWEKKGAFTGEVSAEMLLDVGVEYVIIGHSERRNIFGETDELINLKLKSAISYGLKPVLCIGEHLAEREAGRTMDKIKFQLDSDLSNVDINKVIIAYEPIWAIGTGKTASPDQAEEVHSFISEFLGSKIKILYGGSVKPENAYQLMVQPHINGVLVGGASLKPHSFYDIILAGLKAFKEKK